MSKLTDYVDLLISMSTAQGLSSSNSVMMQPKAGNFIIVSYKEPTDRLFPLNGLWVIADPADASYKKMLRRKTKTATSPYQFTWTEVTDFDDMMNTVQAYADEDLPQPVIVSGKGGKLFGKLLVRDGVTVFDANEIVPKSYTDGVRTAMNNSFFTMFNNLNQRVNINTSDIRTLRTAQNLMGTRLDALEVAKSTIVGKTFLQTDLDSVWSLRHELGQGSGFAFVLSEEGEIIWPETINPSEDDPDNVVLLTFLEPVSGVAQLCYIPTQEPKTT